MPSRLYTTDNLVSEVRSLLDEQNVDSVDTNLDILPALNRGQDYAFDILARKYPEPILTHAPFALTNNQNEYEIPHDVWEDRVLKLEMQVSAGAQLNSTTREIQRISYRDISNYESASKSNIPYYYAVVGRALRFVPTPTGTFSARVWYLRNPEKLVPQQGRITVVNGAGNYIIVDNPGSSLTTVVDQLGSYVNIVDGRNGLIKNTLQIQSISGGKITFRTVPTRSTVVDRDVSGTLVLPAQPPGPNFIPGPEPVAPDDYICAVDGICVPYYGHPTTNFIIQFAVQQLRSQKLGGGNAAEEDTILDKFEKQMERIWVGREKQMRIQKRSSNWGVPTRRWYYE